MDEDAIREQLRNLIKRRNINTSHIHSREYESTWSKIWSVIKQAIKFGAPIAGAIISALHVIPCLLM